jgi:hypothetical protein
MRVLCNDGKIREIIPSSKPNKAICIGDIPTGVVNHFIVATDVTHCGHCKESFGYDEPRSARVLAHSCDRRYIQKNKEKLNKRKVGLYGN